MHDLSFATTFSALAKQRLSPCLIRAEADAASWDDELDVIVSPATLRATLSVLRDLGWELFDTALFDPSRRHLLLWSAGRFLKMDLYTKIVSAGLEYIDANLYLDGAALQGDVFVPSIGNWLLHIVVNTILEKQVLGESYRPRVANALMDPSAVRQATTEATHLGLGYLFEGNAKLEFLFDESAIAGMRIGVRQVLLKKRLANKVRLFWRWAMRKSDKTLALRPGFSVAVTGPDGAGKTTFISTLEEVLNRNGIETRQVYFGPWERPYLPSSKALRRRGADPLDIGEDSPARKSTSKLAKAHLRRMLYYANFLPEMWGRYFGQIWPSILARRVVLLDRHAIDLVTGYYNEPMSNFAWLRSLLARLSPRPHMMILLDNDAQVIWSRKKEFPLGWIQSSLSLYRKAALTYGMIVIKTEQSPEQLVGELMAHHWRDFVRWRRDGFSLLDKW
ncbi:MAG: hypothetical protein ABR976_10305 [Terracidiphilus sp.]